MRGHSQHDLVLHGGLDVALGAKIFRPIVREVVVGRGQVGVEDVEVAGLLDAVPDRRELVGEVAAAGVGGVLRTDKWHSRETNFVVYVVRAGFGAAGNARSRTR